MLNMITKELAANKGLIKIIAYGSRVRGDYSGDSDFDIVVIVDKKNRKMKDEIISIFYNYELEHDMSFGITIFSITEFEHNKKLGSPFIKSVEKEGIVFYDAKRRREKVTI